MVNVPKTKRTFCAGKCRKHTLHKISQYKKGKDSEIAQGVSKSELVKALHNLVLLIHNNQYFDHNDMAKWGEGDPRWIVEERPDAVNVNNWHWTEKNASGWSKERIKSLLNEVRIDDSHIGQVQLTEVTSIEGEAIANNRKAKLIFFYEWVIKGKWAGKPNGVDQIIRGEFEIPNLSEENDPKEIDVIVSYSENSENDSNNLIKELFRTKGASLIQDKLAVYIKELKEEYAKDLILPSKDSKKQNDVTKSVTKINKTELSNTVKPKNNVSLDDLKSLEIEEELKCTDEDFYNALTKEELVSMFTQAKAKVEGKVGGNFSLFGDNVEGTFTKLIPHKLVHQKWRFKNWPKDHFSSVSFEITKNEENIKVKLKQENIPSFDFERTKEGWKRYYFESMKKILGFGSSIF
ncbi:hypothetical protein RND71_044142 [Anisodus tanguticus]|uniref:Activator of Hsp90 ATPase AHSA1-like N-terminal domain-containing protein n=1 Tax=Anisodus tanguticus TaxID=243964 RepID=A0AAE1QSP3_9SOLA|nr:hypothetical protein RND71_044142 [Anisodus tanguticus]